ncbi:MAG: hypothetical protein ACYCQJ_08565 [Nitrososphaerales archaeon]
MGLVAYEQILYRNFGRMFNKLVNAIVTARALRISYHLNELRSREFELLAGITAVTVVEAIVYAWIEVLLYTSDNPILYDTWILGHYTTYHLALAALVLAMMFGVGFVAYFLYSPARLWRFFLLALGNFGLWLMMEDEFTFIFSGAVHTRTDWTTWPIGSVPIFGEYIPIWYVFMTIAVFACWYVGLSIPTD